MMRSTLRPALATLAAAAVLMTAACSAEEPSDAAPSATESAAEETAEAQQPEDGPTDVPNVTGLILETGQSNLMLAGLEAELVDEAGATLEVDDPMTYLVVAQDPAEGQLERGEIVTLTVEPRG